MELVTVLWTTSFVLGQRNISNAERFWELKSYFPQLLTLCLLYFISHLSANICLKIPHVLLLKDEADLFALGLLWSASGGGRCDSEWKDGLKMVCILIRSTLY